MFNPVIAMIHNEKLGRWHPVIFIEDPLPGPPSEDKPVRHKTVGHHTAGFETREEALDDVENDLKARVESEAIGGVKLCLDEDMPWDGEGIPAEMAFFAETPAGLVRAL